MQVCKCDICNKIVVTYCEVNFSYYSKLSDQVEPIKEICTCCKNAIEGFIENELINKNIKGG